MGTVPDPLRSATLLLVAAPEGKHGLGEPPSSKHQSKQASIEKKGNGFPLTAQAQPPGDRLLDGSDAAITGEQHCVHDDANQPSMLSPGALSPSKEGSLAVLEPASSSKQESGNGSSDQAVGESSTTVQMAVKRPATQDLAVGESSTPGQMAVKRPATQEAPEIMQSGDRGQSCKAVLEANSAPGDDVQGNEAHRCVSACMPSAAQEASPAAKETAGENTGPERTHLLERESEAVPDLGATAPVCLGAELLDRKDAGPRPGVEAVPETELKPGLQGAPQPSCNTETEGKAAAERKDTGTMTVWTDSRSAVGEVEHKDRQDAEVQAVAAVENKSICTSPSILAAFLRESVHSEAKEKQEQLHFIYAGAGGKEQSEIVDGCAPLPQTVPSVGMMPEVHIQAPAAVDASGTQVARLQSSDPRGSHGTVCVALSEDGKPPCLLTTGGAQGTSAGQVEAQRASVVSGPGDVSQQPSEASGSSKARPVYQITVNSYDQPGAPPQPGNVETKLPPSAVLSESDGKHQDPKPRIAESDRASPSCRRVSKQEGTRTGVSTQESKEGPLLQIQTVGDLRASPGSPCVDVKPKREEKFISLHPKEQEMGKAGAAAGPQAGCSPGVRKREQHKIPEHNKEAKPSDSQNLGPGPKSEYRRSPAPGRRPQGAKGSGIRKEANLDKTAAPAQHRLNLGGKKEKPGPATEAKVQLKQSKLVRDVVWDEQGMTWEVYGASLDPESLGVAIQNHLQRQIREHEKLLKAQNAQNRKSISSDTSSNKKLKGRQHNVFQSMLQNFRRPNCCVRPTASSVLD